MTIAVTARRDVEHAWKQLAANNASVRQMFRPRLNGKALARHVERKTVAPSASWSAWCDYSSRFANDKKLGGWVALELALTYADHKIADLEKRVAALESELAGKSTAKAAPEKPLRLHLLRAITNASVRPLVEKLEAAHGRDAHISIESPGGDIAAAQKLAAAIERHGACDTTAIIACDSAATIVYAAGRRRSAMKDASFFFHAPSLAGKPAQTAGEQRRLDRIAKDVSAFVAKRAGCKPHTLLEMMTEEGRVIDAIEGSNLGLINATIKRGHVSRKAKK